MGRFSRRLRGAFHGHRRWRRAPWSTAIAVLCGTRCRRPAFSAGAGTPETGAQGGIGRSGLRLVVLPSASLASEVLLGRRVTLGPSDRDDVQHVVELTVLAAVEAVLVRWPEEHGIGAVPVCSPKLECLRNCLTPAVWPIRIAAVSAAALLGEQLGRCALTSSVSSAAS